MDKVDGAALAWCLASKLSSVGQGASLAHADGMNCKVRRGNVVRYASVKRTLRLAPDRIVRKTRSKKEAPTLKDSGSRFFERVI